ncbi:hypothetical protein J132_08423 [Termitomyces sp. J132]|nr:hypothetical protein J132_08423 [Termitomyces sp. J132]
MTLVQPLGRREQIQRLQEKLDTLRKGRVQPCPTVSLESATSLTTEIDPTSANEPCLPFEEALDTNFDVPQETPRPRRIVPDQSAKNLYSAWSDALTRLVAPYLDYITSSTGNVPARLHALSAKCKDVVRCVKKATQILCLFQNYFEKLTVEWCTCEDLLQVLVKNGLFPTSPIQPRMAISVHLLDFYRALFEKSCDAVNAMASALNLFYARRGFVVLNKQGWPVEEPFRRGLGYAAQWYDNLQIRLEQHVDGALLDADSHIRDENFFSSSLTTTQNSSDDGLCFPDTSSQAGVHHPPPPINTSPSNRALFPGECARVLQHRCPACFGGNLFGRSLDKEGGDIHVCVDGNFNHRHLRSAGDSPKFYEPIYILPKEYIDNVGAQIESLRKTRKPHPRQPIVPDEAVNECESSHIAGKGSNVKTNMERYDDSGLMALVCRHDIPIFLANIDTPGEQQKYAVALIEYLFGKLPPCATVALLYDVACVLDRSLHMYDFLSTDITKRMLFATSAMHAYAHQWACQIIYNPRIRTGVGLTDGEGVERLWSRMRKLIAVSRSSGRSRHIYIIDRHVGSIGQELRDDLGSWMRRRLSKRINVQEHKAHQWLTSSSIEKGVLRHEWALQQASELSLRAQAPVRLKKELDVVLTLQSNLDACEKSLESARLTLSESTATPRSLRSLASLQNNQEQLKHDIEDLYASLSIQESFPELRGVDLEFIRILVIARDLKINVRKRAVGSFFEWERLDRASGGRDQPLGTKLHQVTRAGIKKRAPALMAGLKKYNDLCAQLASLYKPEWTIPLPEPLPTDLAMLRDASNLLTDVWISRPADMVPRWLEDKGVRDGIRAMLKIDRCHEERRRLSIEADNLSRWFYREVCAIELALNKAQNVQLRVPLLQRRSHILNLRNRWSSTLLPQDVLHDQARRAQTVAQSLTHHSKQNNHPSSPPLETECLTIVQDSNEFLHSEDIEQPVDLEDSVDHTTDEVLLADYLEAEHEVPETEVIASEGVDVTLIWELPVSHHVFLLTIVVSFKQLQLSFHYSLLQELSFQTIQEFEPLSKPHSFPHLRGCFVFGPRELTIMQSPTAWLNDVCINGIATFLMYKFSQATQITSQYSRKCALFSTFDLLMMHYNVSDTELWRRTQSTEYWNRNIWILPIHRPQSKHWVMCTILPLKGEIHLFDSFADQLPWSDEVQVIMSFVARLIIVANQQGHALHVNTSGWIARPTVMHPLQSNGFDCGVWVLANIAAVLAGFAVTGIMEQEIGLVRSSLLRYLAALPVHQS